MIERDLKPGWRRVKFGDVVRLSKARSKDPMADGIERYVGLEHLEPGDLRIRRWGNVADGVTFTSVFRPGQVLFGKRAPSRFVWNVLIMSSSERAKDCEADASAWRTADS